MAYIGILFGRGHISARLFLLLFVDFVSTSGSLLDIIEYSHM